MWSLFCGFLQERSIKCWIIRWIRTDSRWTWLNWLIESRHIDGLSKFDDQSEPRVYVTPWLGESWPKLPPSMIQKHQSACQSASNKDMGRPRSRYGWTNGSNHFPHCYVEVAFTPGNNIPVSSRQCQWAGVKAGVFELMEPAVMYLGQIQHYSLHRWTCYSPTWGMYARNPKFDWL